MGESHPLRLEKVDGCTECGPVVWDWDRHVLWHGLLSVPSRSPSKPSNPSDTRDPSSVGTVEHMSPQSEQAEEGRGEG